MADLTAFSITELRIGYYLNVKKGLHYLTLNIKFYTRDNT